MLMSMIATHCRRGALLVFATASIGLTASSIAGVNPSSCPSQTSVAKPAHRVAAMGPGLLGIVRQFARSQAVLPTTTTTAVTERVDQGIGTPAGQLTEQAMRARIASYQVSPMTEQRQASLSVESQASCWD
ncbi:MAG: hypothetical protein C1943_15095 [Halochromatium sp.]|nr:hypothetical protein [Halochromatium sp.]